MNIQWQHKVRGLDLQPSQRCRRQEVILQSMVSEVILVQRPFRPLLGANDQEEEHHDPSCRYGHQTLL